MQKVMESEMKSITAGDLVCYYEITCPHCQDVVSRKGYIGFLSYQVAKAKAQAEYRNHLYECYEQFL